MLQKYFHRSPFIAFLPFLGFFILLVVKLHSDTMEGDEIRYYNLARNLLNGHYSPPPPDIKLWNGPGYPIVLLPFVAFGLPLISIPLLNAVFHYLSIVLLFLTLKKYLSHKKAIGLTLFWACYYIAYQEMALILTESLTLFLCAFIGYSLSAVFKCSSHKNLYLCGLLIGFLVLTKVVFSYVLLITWVGSILFFLFKRSLNYRKLFICLTIAFVVNTPYLFYTWSLTGKILYWSNAGGESLYWMSTPYENEFGEWHGEVFENGLYDAETVYQNAMLLKNHGDDIKYLSQFSGVEKDRMYKKLAIENIKEHPIKFMQNCIANIGRMFFGFPFSYTYQRIQTLVRIPPNSILLTLMIFSIIPTVRRWKQIPFEIRYTLIFTFIYLGLSTMVSAYPRQLYVVVPLLLWWIGFILEKTVKIKPGFHN